MVCSYQGDCEQKTSTDFFAEFEIYTIYIACFVHTIVWGIGLKIADIKKDGGNIFTSSDSMEKRIGKSKVCISVWKPTKYVQIALTLCVFCFSWKFAQSEISISTSFTLCYSFILSKAAAQSVKRTKWNRTMWGLPVQW